jgi:serine/threonine-protein kinase
VEPGTGRYTALLDGALIGRLLDGRYAVQARLAQGGMASVYQAFDNRLDRLVALKVIDPELARHPAYVERFIREAKAAARLSHPNIVAVYDQSALPGGPGQPPLAYLAMELVPGLTLRQLLGRRGRLSPREALEIVDAMLAGLAAAHRAGIVHRDVKPENVLLSEDALRHQRTYAAAVKVTDFGLARSAAAGENGNSLSSSFDGLRAGNGNGQNGGQRGGGGGLIGTVSYLAPELVQHGACDARSDVYSAGIVLFELMTGRKPFTGGTPLEIARRHVTDRVPPPSLLRPGLDPALDALVATACAREPGERPADAAAFRARLRAVYASLPDTALDFGAPGGLEPTVPTAQPAGMPDHTRVDTSGYSAPNPTMVAGQPPVRINRGGNRGDIRGNTRSDIRGNTQAGPAGPQPRIKPRTSPRQGYSVDAGRPPRRIRGLIIFLVVLLLAAAVGIGAYLYGQLAFQSTPNLRGLPKSQAADTLNKDGLKVAYGSAFDDNVPTGDVVSSDPSPGTPVKNGSTVTLVISKGTQNLAIPDVTGQSQADATSRLKGAGFNVSVAADQVSSDTVDAGSVVSFKPTGSAPRGTTITLTISNGPRQVFLPDVTGQNVNDAKSQLQSLGFNVVVNRYLPFVSGVSSQSPSGNSQQPFGSTVTLSLF